MNGNVSGIIKQNKEPKHEREMFFYDICGTDIFSRLLIYYNYIEYNCVILLKYPTRDFGDYQDYIHQFLMLMRDYERESLCNFE